MVFLGQLSLMVNESICHSHALLKWNCHKTPSQSGCSFSSYTGCANTKTAYLWGLGLGGNREKCSTTFDIIGGMLFNFSTPDIPNLEKRGQGPHNCDGGTSNSRSHIQTSRAQTTEWIVTEIANLYVRDVQWLPSLPFRMRANESL